MKSIRQYIKKVYLQSKKVYLVRNKTQHHRNKVHLQKNDVQFFRIQVHLQKNKVKISRIKVHLWRNEVQFSRIKVQSLRKAQYLFRDDGIGLRPHDRWSANAPLEQRPLEASVGRVVAPRRRTTSVIACYYHQRILQHTNLVEPLKHSSQLPTKVTFTGYSKRDKMQQPRVKRG